MRIGISGVNKVVIDELSNHLKKEYGFHILDLDLIVNSLIKENNDISYSDILLYLNDYINTLLYEDKSMDKDIIIKYSLLEDLSVFDDCEIRIKANDYSNDVNIVSNEYRNDIINSKVNDSYYHLILDDNWKDKVNNYMNRNVYNDVKVSVVIPIYNTDKYLSRMVNSVMNQTYRNIEIILIDDGSTDKSLEMCNYLAKKDSRIRVYHQTNKGLAETRNVGMNLATGSYISFLDSDDYIDNDMIGEMVNRALETDCDVCQGGFWIHMKDGFVKDVTNEQNGADYFEGKEDVINAHADHLISIATWDKLYKLSSIKDMKFDKNVTKEDADYSFRLCLEGKSFAIVKKPFYHYIKRQSSSLTADKISPKIFKLQTWGHEAYDEVLSYGEEYRDAAEKFLYNSLVHIMRNYMRDYKRNVLEKDEYKEELQSVCNELIILLLQANNVQKFRKLDEVIDIINEFTINNVIDKDKIPTIDVPCIGILWNSLDSEMKKEAVKLISEKAEITDLLDIDLGKDYDSFIRDVYRYNNEFEGVGVIKSGILIDRYDNNSIEILNMVVKVSNYLFYSKKKGYLYSEVSNLKTQVREDFKHKIRDYAYDNVFHLTVDEDEYKYTDNVCKKYIKEYGSKKYEK